MTCLLCVCVCERGLTRLPCPNELLSVCSTCVLVPGRQKSGGQCCSFIRQLTTESTCCRGQTSFQNLSKRDEQSKKCAALCLQEVAENRNHQMKAVDGSNTELAPIPA